LSKAATKLRPLINAALNRKSAELEVFDTDVGMPEKIGLVIGRGQQLQGHGGGVEKSPNTSRRATAHLGKDADQVGSPQTSSRRSLVSGGTLLV
jgi:hypothetical protein